MTMEDEFLIGSCLGGDQGSLGLLYSKYFSKVYQTCYTYSRNRDDAFDLAQDVLMKAFGNLASFKGGSAFSTWLYSIARNHCINQLAKQRGIHNEGVEVAFEVQEEEPDHEELLERIRREELESELDRTLSLLPLIDKRMMELRYHQNYSVKALQKEFNLSASAVKMRLLRARQKVEQILMIGNAA